jgi:hypothetical protein
MPSTPPALCAFLILGCLPVLIIGPMCSGATFGADNGVQRAGQEAKKYSGTITVAWKAGFQSLDPLTYSRPSLGKLTGIEVKVVKR